MKSNNRPVIVVTGAAGNLGHTVIKIIQKQGVRIAMIGRSEETLRKLYGENFVTNDIFILPNIDLTQPDRTILSMDDIIKHFGRIDTLVHTVGAFKGGKPVHEEDLATWNFLFNVNVCTALNCCRAVIPYMVKQKSGRIITVISRHAFRGAGNYAAYSAAKGALLRLSESLSEELKIFNIMVNSVVPGTMDTPQNREAMPKVDFSKWISPDAVADVIQFLLSTRSRGITGAAIPVYGKS
jgi:NAD(P)-dependent dehydrogenase (short-subunit alcohol dehydrogenase family)